MEKVRKIFSLLVVLSIFSCAKNQQNGSQIDASYDGAIVIETDLSDMELASYGNEVIYRFESIPKLVAIKPKDSRVLKNNEIYSNTNEILNKNSKKVYQNNNNIKRELNLGNCHFSYCESGFQSVMENINKNKLNLENVKVAIIDSGVKIRDEIKNQIEQEINITDDLNTENWSDHGTNIASIFTGFSKSNEVENSYAKNAKIYSIKVNVDSDNINNMQKKFGSMQLAVALDKAVILGAKIVNISLQYNNEPDKNVSSIEKLLISKAAEKGVLFVLAAGNENKNLDSEPSYPSGYSLNNIITVGSHYYDYNELKLMKSYFSNYGHSVDISAQGNDIEVINKSGHQVKQSGTSFSTPIVSSALSIYFGLYPNADLNTTLEHLYSSAIGDKNTTTKYGRLNLNTMIQLGKNKYLQSF
ncbi:S8 family peptidase [Silvanigrella aquatica]|uniref:Peptidase S8/S53 domain-containing protein n=1 Tax=Silvanigrella aquatica TaxID=1915309 RepID=A0A1L4D390_9BACT|nr:S8 family serine peptidase [Silvanigrella aquatica]APJ04675.1 hypothetical protein AXG55_12485 [Silvanigrella aquatica]